MAENLILYGHSGFLAQKLGDLSNITAGLPETAVILMEDGVLGTNKAGNETYSGLLTANVKIYAVKEDLLARGISKEQVTTGIEVVDYGGVIDLIDQTPRVISWL